MEYISKEEFSNQELGVQRIFKEYFECESMLFWNYDKMIYWKFEDLDCNTPAFTEGQLRKFIEDKTGKKVQTTIRPNGKYTIDFINVKGDYCTFFKEEESIRTNTINLLQAFWKVACEIAKEGI